MVNYYVLSLGILDPLLLLSKMSTMRHMYFVVATAVRFKNESGDQFSLLPIPAGNQWLHLITFVLIIHRIIIRHNINLHY